MGTWILLLGVVVMAGVGFLHIAFKTERESMARERKAIQDFIERHQDTSPGWLAVMVGCGKHWDPDFDAERLL